MSGVEPANLFAQSQRLTYCMAMTIWVINLQNFNESDEAHFLLNGYVNKQNCRIWSEANPQVYVETPLHPEKQTVLCALWAGGVIGPYFFKNDEGHDHQIRRRESSQSFLYHNP
ncbi:hypothetical protein TNCV_5082691 [Trichonephila clavipes]|nr:hypothetical protein TNCV_5082691 [Trichonephila clavipes]